MLLTLIARVPDGLMLCESAAAPADDLGGAHTGAAAKKRAGGVATTPTDLRDGSRSAAAANTEPEGAAAQMELHRAQAKQVLRKLEERSPPRLVVEAGPNAYYAYVMRPPVCVLAVCARTYPRRLAFDFVAEVLREFETSHGAEVARATRPYQFIAFDAFVRRTQRLYADERSRLAVEKVAEDLRDAQRVMTQSIQDILERGEKISAVASRSEQLVAESSRYSRQARDFERAMWWRRRAPLFAVGGITILLLLLRFFIF